MGSQRAGKLVSLRVLGIRAFPIEIDRNATVLTRAPFEGSASAELVTL